MVGISGLALTAQEGEMLCHPLIGGVILFERNYENSAQLSALTEQIHTLRTPHLLIAVDHEGGRVQRFRNEFTLLPKASTLGEIYDQAPARAKRLAETVGWLMASELRAVGIDFSFAPILDLNRGISSVIGDRALHQTPAGVIALAHACMHGMRSAGMAATGKHFPGHGAISSDSHHEVACDERRREDICCEDMAVFEHMVESGIAAIMMAHVIYPAVDSAPAGFSACWVNDVLRKQMGFQGVIFSDDLGMVGAEPAGNMLDRARAALQAGCDMVLVCNELAAIPILLDGIDIPLNPAAHLRLARMHGRGASDRATLFDDPRWQQAVSAISRHVSREESGLL